METVKKDLKFNDYGVYKVDRIDDLMDWHDFDESAILEARNMEEALEEFENDPNAYALRFVPYGTSLFAYRGRLMAYKPTPFPVILPWVESVRGWSNEFRHIACEEEDPQLEYVESIIYCCNDYFQNFPELEPELHKQILGLMLKVRDLLSESDFGEADYTNCQLNDFVQDYLGREADYRDDAYTLPLHKRYQFLEPQIENQLQQELIA